jgi:RimJ/RimL family protein N-acetyltransferase
MATPPSLFTSRLRLREWHPEDVDAVVAIKTDAENWRFIGNGEPRTLETAGTVLLEFQHEWRTHGIGRWAVEEQAAGEIIGDCGIVVSARGPQLAYMIGRSRWGQGFATEAARAVLLYVFNTLEWRAVFASTHTQNIASRRVLEKLGFCHAQPVDAPDGSECWYELERNAFSS